MALRRLPPKTGSLTLHLLDAAQGHPVQTWRFEDRGLVTIGRAPESDIAIVDPQVSRCHAELRFHEGVWSLVSMGRNGTLVDGDRVNETHLCDQTIFQLGGTGPTFMFCMVTGGYNDLATTNPFDPNSLAFLNVNEHDKQQQVRQIIDGEAFKALQAQSRKLKESNGPGN